jgi:hypothetical protein
MCFILHVHGNFPPAVEELSVKNRVSPENQFLGGEKGSKFLNYLLSRNWQKYHVLPRIIK